MLHKAGGCSIGSISRSAVAVHQQHRGEQDKRKLKQSYSYSGSSGYCHTIQSSKPASSQRRQFNRYNTDYNIQVSLINLLQCYSFLEFRENKNIVRGFLGG